MSLRSIFLLVLVLLAWPVSAQERVAFEYGPRPPLSVFDPSGVLRPEVVKEISDPLTAIYQKEGIDVLVIVLADLEEAPAEHVARLFSRAWSKSEIHCVVLHVPGHFESPWIIPAGKVTEVISPDQIDKLVAEAWLRATREPDDSGKIRAAANEAADMLRHWTDYVINHNELVRTERLKLLIKQEKEARMWRVGILMGLIGIVPLAGFIWLIVRFFRKRAPRCFPHRSWQPRLGAPYAGGNRAVVKIGPLPP